MSHIWKWQLNYTEWYWYRDIVTIINNNDIYKLGGKWEYNLFILNMVQFSQNPGVFNHIHNSFNKIINIRIYTTLYLPKYGHI